jgi:hypothetical protein
VSLYSDRAGEPSIGRRAVMAVSPLSFLFPGDVSGRRASDVGGGASILSRWRGRIFAISREMVGWWGGFCVEVCGSERIFAASLESRGNL